MLFLMLVYMDPINDVPLSPDSKLLLYADDILLYSPIWQTSDFTSIQSDMDSISQWVCQSGLRLNAAKTRFVLFSRQCYPLSTLVETRGTRKMKLPVQKTHLTLGIQTDRSDVVIPV